LHVKVSDFYMYYLGQETKKLYFLILRKTFVKITDI